MVRVHMTCIFVRKAPLEGLGALTSLTSARKQCLPLRQLKALLKKLEFVQTI